jgi:hypothetical protein
MAVWSSIFISKAIEEKRIDAEYYTPEALQVERAIISCPHEKLFSLSKKITDFGAYSQMNNVTYSDVGDHRFIRNQDVKGFYLDYKDNTIISKDVYNALSLHLNKNDILIQRTGTIGKAAIVLERDLPATANQNLAQIIVNDNKLNPFYLITYFNSKFGIKSFERLQTGNVQPWLNLKQIGNLRIPCFTSEIQNEIGTISEEGLSRYFASINLHSQAKQVLESELGLDKLNYKRSLSYIVNASEVEASRRLDSEFFDPITSAIIKKIKSLDHVKLGENCVVGNGFPWSSEKFLPNNSGEPVVRIRNIKPSYIDIEELTSIEPSYARKVGFTKAKRGDVVIGMDGLKYFYASLLESSCYVNQRVAHLTWLPNTKISPEYATFINSRVGQAQLLSNMTVATTVGHITNRDISKLLIPYISDSFHQKITELVRQSIDKKQESKRLLEQAKTRVEQLIEEAVQP